MEGAGHEYRKAVFPFEPKTCETGEAGSGGSRAYWLSLVRIMIDLLGDAMPMARKNDRPEAAALAEVLLALTAHPAVAWAHRMNSGAVRIGSRFVRFGWPCCPDVLGQLRDGRLLGVEVKAPKGKLRPEQALFLEHIRCAGGVAFMARDCRDVFRELEQIHKNVMPVAADGLGDLIHGGNF